MEPAEQHRELPLVHADRAQVLAELTVEHNRMLRSVSKTVRTALGTESPANFHVVHGRRPAGTEAQQRDSMLAALALQCGQHALVSISLRDFLVDPHFIDRRSQQGAPRLAAVLRRCKRLRSLNLCDARINVWTEIGTALVECAELERLNVSGCALREQAEDLAVALHAASRLTELHLARNMLGLENLRWITAALPRCTALRYLTLSDNRLCNSAGPCLAGALPLLPSLEELDLSRNRLGDAFVAALAPALRHCRKLQELSLASNSLDPASADTLSLRENHCASLRYLDLRENFLQIEGLGFFASRSFGAGLSHLDLGRNFIRWPNDPVPQACSAQDLPHIYGLVHLLLCNNCLGNTFMRTLVRELPRCRSLELLDLTNTHVSDAGVAGLPAVIPQCRRLARLLLAGEHNKFSGATSAAIRRAWEDSRASIEWDEGGGVFGDGTDGLRLNRAQDTEAAAGLLPAA